MNHGRKLMKVESGGCIVIRCWNSEIAILNVILGTDIYSYFLVLSRDVERCPKAHTSCLYNNLENFRNKLGPFQIYAVIPRNWKRKRIMRDRKGRTQWMKEKVNEKKEQGNLYTTLGWIRIG
jgi:hypothetical protein